MIRPTNEGTKAVDPGMALRFADAISVSVIDISSYIPKKQSAVLPAGQAVLHSVSLHDMR